MQYARFNITGKFTMVSHAHTGAEINYLATGKAYYLIGNEKVELRKGDILFLNPKRIHRLEITDESTVLYCVECHEYPDEQEQEYRKIRSDNLMREIFLDMISVDYESGITDSAFRYLCELISRTEKRKNDGIERARRYILQNYMNDLTVSLIARESFISPAQLQRGFKKEFGYSVGEYLTKVRMFEARSLIVNTNIPIGEIDSCIGMKSRNSFTKAFKKEFGISPREIRKKRKE